MQIEARNVILFSRREAARTGIRLPGQDARAKHIHEHLKLSAGDTLRIGVVNGLKVRTPRFQCYAKHGPCLHATVSYSADAISNVHTACLP